MYLPPALPGFDDVVEALKQLVIWLGVQFALLWTLILHGIKAAFLWLFDLGIALTAWLPDHSPIAWPDPGSWGLLFRGLGVVSRFVDLPVLFGVLGTGLAFTTARLAYSVWRLILGIAPAAK